jgi:hypothetical protein
MKCFYPIRADVFSLTETESAEIVACFIERMVDCMPEDGSFLGRLNGPNKVLGLLNILNTEIEDTISARVTS